MVRTEIVTAESIDPESVVLIKERRWRVVANEDQVEGNPHLVEMTLTKGDGFQRTIKIDRLTPLEIVL